MARSGSLRQRWVPFLGIIAFWSYYSTSVDKLLGNVTYPPASSFWDVIFSHHEIKFPVNAVELRQHPQPQDADGQQQPITPGHDEAQPASDTHSVHQLPDEGATPFEIGNVGEPEEQDPNFHREEYHDGHVDTTDRIHTRHDLPELHVSTSINAPPGRVESPEDDSAGLRRRLDATRRPESS